MPCGGLSADKSKEVEANRWKTDVMEWEENRMNADSLSFLPRPQEAAAKCSLLLLSLQVRTKLNQLSAGNTSDPRNTIGGNERRMLLIS